MAMDMVLPCKDSMVIVLVDRRMKVRFLVGGVRVGHSSIFSSKKLTYIPLSICTIIILHLHGNMISIAIMGDHFKNPIVFGMI